MSRKKVSILGDSVSSYEGYTPDGFAFYGPWNGEYTGVCSVEDTWWMQVIRALDAELCKNNSLSGSLVSGRSVVSATSAGRIADLGSEGDPDLILVAMGANDWGFGFLPEEFESEYRRLIHLLKAAYPGARIWCATLPEGKVREGEESFFDVDSTISRKVYSDIIRKAAQESEVYVADLYRCGEEYSSIDGVHPDKEGMKVLAKLWLKFLTADPR